MALAISPHFSHPRWWKQFFLLIGPTGKERARGPRALSIPGGPFHPGLPPPPPPGWGGGWMQIFWVQVEVWMVANLIPGRNHSSDFCLGANLSSSQVWWKFGGPWFSRAHQNHLLEMCRHLASVQPPGIKDCGKEVVDVCLCFVVVF